MVYYIIQDTSPFREILIFFSALNNYTYLFLCLFCLVFYVLSLMARDYNGEEKDKKIMNETRKFPVPWVQYELIFLYDLFLRSSLYHQPGGCAFLSLLLDPSLQVPSFSSIFIYSIVHIFNGFLRKKTGEIEFFEILGNHSFLQILTILTPHPLWVTLHF